MRFAKEYVENVLRQNFQDFRELFFMQLLDIHYAHLVMLHESGILSTENARRLVRALDSIEPGFLDKVDFDGSFEDAFCFMEEQLAGLAGPDTAGRLHTARSRNDIDVTLYRLRWRLDFAAVQSATLDLRSVLLDLCLRELDTILPLHTHTQPAQPSTVAHYLHAIVEHLERDYERFRHALLTLNRNPLGSCAITGTGFPIDRDRTSDLLAFDGPTGNTYAGIASADYLLEGISAAAVLLSMLGRFIQDLLQWSTREFGVLHLGDGYVQPSSIMPQKRNPVSLEHSRALASRALGQAHAVFQVLHNTPFGDIVDVEDDLQPLVFRTLQDTVRPLRLLAAALSTASFDRPMLERRAGEGWITITDLSDALVSREGIPFRTAHELSRVVIQSVDQGKADSPEEALADASRELTGREIRMTGTELSELLNPRAFVNRRKTFGGPSPSVMSQALSESRQILATDRSDLESFLARVNGYRDRLRQIAREI
jgi:argininosuccinate lyase